MENLNFDPEYLSSDNSGSGIAPTVVILVFTTVLLPIRLYASSLTPNGRGWDEFLLPGAWVLLVGSCALNFVLVDQGLIGRPLEAVLSLSEEESTRAITLSNMIVWVLMILTSLSNYFSRISIVIVFLRVFYTGKVRTASWALLVFLTAFVIAQIISFGVTYIPIQALWDEEAQIGAKCIDRVALYQSYGILNILTDIAIIVTPVSTVWSLQCSRARKTGLAVTFASGGVGIFASCARTVYFFRWTSETTEPEIWASTIPLCGWTIVETGMYLAAACFVGMRPFLSMVLSASKARLGWSSLRTWYKGPSHDEENQGMPKTETSTTAS